MINKNWGFMKRIALALLSMFMLAGILAGTANAADSVDSTDVGNVDLGDDSSVIMPPPDVPQSIMQPTGDDGESIMVDDPNDPDATVQDANGIWVPWHSCDISPQIPALSVYPADHVVASSYTSCNRSTATDSYVQLQYTDRNGYWRVFGTTHRHGDATAKYWSYKSAACAYPSRSRWWRTKAWVDYQAISGSGIWDRRTHYSVARWIGHCR